MTIRNNVRNLVRKGQQGQDGKLGNSVTIEARQNGVVINRMDLPCEQPAPVFMFIQQACAAMAHAAQDQKKKQLLLGVVPRWKAWIIVHILRAK